MKPFLKWTGGKYRMLSQLDALLPQDELCKRDGLYIEPFLGSGAMFFHLSAGRRIASKRAVLADLNGALIRTFQAIKTGELRAVVRHLTTLKRDHDVQMYNAVRENFNNAQLNTSLEGQAARFIYLNKTCWNGVWRVNRQGKFNVPMGDYKNPEIFDPAVLAACREALAGAKLGIEPFETIVRTYAKRGAFVYLDPPYEPASETANFTSYVANGGYIDLLDLRAVCVHLNNIGARFMLSNSNTPRVREVFKRFRIDEVSRQGNINSDVSKRGAVSELVIRNYR